MSGRHTNSINLDLHSLRPSGSCSRQWSPASGPMLNSASAACTSLIRLRTVNVNVAGLEVMLGSRYACKRRSCCEGLQKQAAGSAAPPACNPLVSLDTPWIAQRQATPPAATQPAQVDVRVERIAGMGKVTVWDEDDGQVRAKTKERYDEDKANGRLLGSRTDCARSSERAVPDGRALVGRAGSGCEDVHPDLDGARRRDLANASTLTIRWSHLVRGVLRRHDYRGYVLRAVDDPDRHWIRPGRVRKGHPISLLREKALCSCA